MDPTELIRHANRLIQAQRGAPRQVDLRRAISAAYYAVFHCFLKTAADNLIGATAAARRSSTYSILYRSFEHSTMLRVCEDVAKANLPEKLRAVLGKQQFPQEIRYAATAFVDLQDLRHKADYNPKFRFYKSDALAAAVRAVFAITQLAAANPEDRREFLLLMICKMR
jgi:hypothetical protein